MGLLDRLLGREKATAARERRTPLSLQLLFAGRLRLNVNTLAAALREFSPALAEVRFEMDMPAGSRMGAEVGVARFADGHTAEWQGRQVRPRVPGRAERKFLDSEGELFVLEPREPA